MLIHRMYVRWDNTWGRFGSCLSRDDWKLSSVIGFLLKQSKVTSSSSLLGRDIPDRSQPNQCRLAIGCRNWDGISLSTSDASNWKKCSLTKYFYNHFWKLKCNTTFLLMHSIPQLPRINSATFSGGESIGTWLVGRVRVFAFKRFAVSRSSSGWIVL